VATIEKRLRMTQRLPQRSSAFHRHQIGEVLHHRTLVLRVEEVIGGRKRDEILAVLAQRHLRQSHVEVRAVIRSDEEVRVRWDIRTAFVMRTQELLVKETLEEIGGIVSRRAHERRYVNLVITLATIVDLRSFFHCGCARMATHYGQ